jgi:hypothetical protein
MTSGRIANLQRNPATRTQAEQAEGDRWDGEAGGRRDHGQQAERGGHDQHPGQDQDTRAGPGDELGAGRVADQRGDGQRDEGQGGLDRRRLRDAKFANGLDIVLDGLATRLPREGPGS